MKSLRLIPLLVVAALAACTASPTLAPTHEGAVPSFDASDPEGAEDPGRSGVSTMGSGG